MPKAAFHCTGVGSGAWGAFPQCPEELGVERNPLEIMAMWEFLQSLQQIAVLQGAAFPRASRGVWRNVLWQFPLCSPVSCAFVLFIFVSFILVLQGWAGVGSGVFFSLCSSLESCRIHGFPVSWRNWVVLPNPGQWNANLPLLSACYFNFTVS